MRRRKLVLLAGLAAMLAGLGLVGTWAISSGHGELTFKVYSKRLVMTGAYKAYGNPEAVSGRYWFGKVILQNVGQSSVRDVRVSYQVPGYLPWTTPDEAADILPGGTAVFIYYPKFPSTITDLRTRAPAVLETKIDFADAFGQRSHVEKREFEFLGLTEFSFTSVPASEVVEYSDRFDNDPLLGAYVHDEDPAVKTFYAKVSEASGGIDLIETRERDMTGSCGSWSL